MKIQRRHKPGLPSPVAILDEDLRYLAATAIERNGNLTYVEIEEARQ